MSRDEFVVSDERLLPEFDAAGHVDEGTVHAWLDGAFDAAAAAQVTQHVEACAPCAALVAEARGLVAASTRVLSALDAPAVSRSQSATVTRDAHTAHAAMQRLASPRVVRAQWWWRAAAGLFVVVGGTLLLRERAVSAPPRPTDIAAGTPLPQAGADAAATSPNSAAAPATPAAPAAPPATATAAAPVIVPPTTVANAVEPVPSPVEAAPLTPSKATAELAAIAPPVAPSPMAPMRSAADMQRTRSMPVPSAAPMAQARMAAPVGEVDALERRRRTGGDREQYDRIEDNPFLAVQHNALSTFSIDVDRASYSNVRRFIESGQRPPRDAVRIEELINYFPYDLPEPRGNDPVAITSEVMAAPWQPQHRLVRIALQARRIATAALPPSNLVFLVDVSGSMNEWNKLPLVKQSLRLLVNELRPQDHVAIVAYAGAAGLVLPSTSGEEKARIMDAIERLEAGGSTAGGAGIELAYRTAREHFREDGNNRVILATDGDFNVGVSSDAELERLVEQRRRDGTYLTVLGYGTGNYQAAKMEKLAKVGNGNHAYVDSPAEARKVLVEEMGATLYTVANDVKLQVEFNPATVQAYRLIGYENRLLANEDFTDDTKDAGDIGTGHQVTALYEVVPAGVAGTVTVRGVEARRYTPTEPSTSVVEPRAASNELLYVKLRYKRPGESASRLLAHPVGTRAASRPSADTRFIAAVASFGMLLRESEHRGNSSAAQVLEQARAALGEDRGGYRAEFIRLVERWRALGITAGERR